MVKDVPVEIAVTDITTVLDVRFVMMTTSLVVTQAVLTTSVVAAENVEDPAHASVPCLTNNALPAVARTTWPVV